MHITIHGKNIEITEALRSYAEKKLTKLAKYLDTIIEIHVTMHVDKTKDKDRQHVVEVTVHSGGRTMRATEESSDLYAAIDLVYEKLEKQARKEKDKRRDLARRSASFRDKAWEEVKTIKEEPEIEYREIHAKPMSIEEAMEQLKISDMFFLIFKNSETNKVNVIYKKNSGTFTVVEPR